ncbi:hypothetical protein J3R82DRAFT_9079 [Butyriboletus roseoflavus]|nr:hypothetical protein J3R82DRAFT_9079 [Butyriboletus roseoflavus]
MNNIQVVDSIVRETEKLFLDFYGDDETSFVFTADHDPDNTQTPLIAWGKGVRGPLPDSSPSSHDDFSQPWKLEHVLRRDVSQADIAPLMASLVGINWPVNSVGVLPDVDHSRAGFLDPRGGEEALAHAALVNTQVLLEHYRVKHARMRKLGSIEHSLREGRWIEARRQSAQLINTCLEGLRYLETYDRFLIRFIVIVAYVGWAAYTSIPLLPALDSPPVSAARIGLVDAFTLLTFFGSAMAFWIQNSPWTFYVYVAFPCYFWRVFYLRGIPALLRAISQSSFSSRQLCIYGLLVISLTPEHGGMRVSSS